MRKSIIQANVDLVLNGDFKRAFSGWKKGSVSQDYLGIESEEYQSILTPFLAAGNESSVSQEIELPKKSDPDAKYVLSFLCETRHTKAGLLRISINGTEEKQEISLAPGKQRNQEEGQPLAFIPVEYTVELRLPFKSQDRVTISVFSPKNEPSDYLSKICITRINLALHLAPAEMQARWFDDMPVPTDGTLHLCVGALHTLMFELAPDNVWKDTHAALISENNPDGAVVAKPLWGENQSIADKWEINCPWMEVDEPRLLSLSLHNQYTADPYLMNVSLGHHRLAFREVLEAAYYPVLEFSQGVRLGVQVISHYTSLPVSGRPVTWTLGGQQVMGVTDTSDEGWAYFDFEPTQAGEVGIEASVESLYFATGVVTHTFAVLVLATDPWKDLLAVVEGVATRWEEKKGYPNRGSGYRVIVKLPATLVGTEFALHWSGDAHEQLGVVVSPALESSVPGTGGELVWTLTSEDRLDGRFELSLVCSKLLLPSPKKTMSLARNVVKVGDVREANKFPEVDEQESVLLRVQVVHEVNGGTGDPVIGALVDWKVNGVTSSTRSGTGGWASFLFTPIHPISYVVTASIRAHLEAVAVEREFNVQAMANNPWRREVKILLDEKEVERVELGVLCRRGQTHTLKVVPVSGSPWIDKNISLHWRGVAPDIGLVPTDLGTPKPLVATGVEWKLVSEANASISSLFDLELRLEGHSIVREIFGRLVSVDLKEEMRVVLDQIPAALDGQTLHPCLGASHRFNVLPNALSPLVGLVASLTWSGTPADQLGATIRPESGVLQPLSDGNTVWELDFEASREPGQFALTLALPQLSFVAAATPMLLAHNKVRIEKWYEPAVDPVVGQEPTSLWVQVFSHFTGKAVGEVPVKWKDASVVSTDEEGWSGFDFSPVDADQEHQVKAVVESPYDGYREQCLMTVRALASDPWAGLRVSFDKQAFQPWGQKTCFPRRNGEHSIDLEAAENSSLFGRVLTLGMTGTGPAALGISFLSEGLGVPRPFYDLGLQYLFRVGDLKDGSFAFRLSSERLASLSPANAMSVGEGSQVLKISTNSSAFQTLDWGQAFVGTVTVVSVISGRPMVGWTVTWRSPDLGVVTSRTNYYGVATISFIPTTPGAAELTATVGDELNSESIALIYTLNEPRTIVELIEVNDSVLVNDRAMETRVRAKVLSSRTGLPLENVEVMWEYDNQTLPSSFTGADGFAYLSFGHDVQNMAVLWATVKGGASGWDSVPLVYKQEAVIRSLTCDRPNTYPGHEVNARVTVIGALTGRPLKGITIRWSFAGASLPDSVSDDAGVASVTFETLGVGEYQLVASLDSTVPGSKTQVITVNPLVDSMLLGIYAFPAVIRAGQSSIISVQVKSLAFLKPQAGRRVQWKVNGHPLASTYSNDGGWTSFEYRGNEPGDIRFDSSVKNQVGSANTSIVLKVLE
ncbi:Ig-like domain-containing protein [Pseudomonas sp. LB1P83]